MPNERRKGIQQSDVEHAADQLLAAGERPTIEKVRMQLGRGSPNTIAPLLDLWFSGLGRRVRGLAGAEGWGDQLPASLLATAEALWRHAQTEAGQVAGQELNAAKEALAQLEQRVNERAQALVQQEALLLERQSSLERSLQAAQLQIGTLEQGLAVANQDSQAKAQRINTLEASLRLNQERRDEDAARHQQALQQLTEDRRRADERYDSASVRSALEIDRLRQELKAERQQRQINEKEWKEALELSQKAYLHLKSEHEQGQALHAAALRTWQQERTAAQDQLEKLQADWQSREALWLEQQSQALKAVDPAPSRAGKPSQVTPANNKSLVKPKVRRSAARPSGAWRLKRQG
ncbi:DNA-binding protein [Curvibacter sp. RS43]|uniref:DNA-binding protein n=1 Tax=Curvibacter microcysteis TaxID=3026419 RepID=UPI002362F67C|nr:DNA-binding protein [Curvibacter sp. RS43]MDD0810015.1 DNA-binding protein [Curvibacter sp. RS43]